MYAFWLQLNVFRNFEKYSKYVTNTTMTIVLAKMNHSPEYRETGFECAKGARTFFSTTEALK